MTTIRTSKSLVGHRDEIEAMTIIINIQMMQEKIHGKSFYHWQFNGNTIEELRELQEQMIKEYNATFKQQ